MANTLSQHTNYPAETAAEGTRDVDAAKDTDSRDAAMIAGTIAAREASAQTAVRDVLPAREAAHQAMADTHKKD